MNLVSLFHHETNLQTIPAGQAVFTAGEPGCLMYILMSGTAEIIVHDKVVEVAEPGAMLGEMAMIDEENRSATVVAKTECKILPVDRARFHFLVQETPNFAVYVMKVIASRLRKTDAML